ncbi:phosphatase PAP2 family protein [Candidatus Microgenomates bacterium]|nr:phosphatase PAP2 family protein [Candidatus Microgenomates bacterium]
MFRQRTAKVISAFSHPVTVFPLTFPIFISRVTLTVEQIYLLFLIVLIILTPFFYLLFQIKKGEIKDWDVTERKQRYPIYLIAVVSGTVAMVILRFFEHPHTFLVALTFYLLVLSVTAINFFWKISAHTTTITAAVLLFYFLVQPMPYLFLLVPLVCWSRYEEKKHTWGQIFSGVGLAILVVFGVLSLVGGKALNF